MRRNILVSTLCFVSLICSACCWAQSASSARTIIDANGPAVVNVQIVIETTSTYEGETEKEQNKNSVTGTIIDPSGLCVTSLMETNPREMSSAFGEEEEGFKSSSEIIDVKIKTNDGVEIPADVVLRDKDLDLTFIRPKKAPEKPLPFVDLSQFSEPGVLDEVVVLSRLGVVANRSIGATLDRVRAIVTKPRKFYILTATLHAGLGGPAFTLDGKPAGLVLMKTSMSGAENSEMSSGIDDAFSIVVLPGSTILKSAEQAKNAELR